MLQQTTVFGILLSPPLLTGNASGTSLCTAREPSHASPLPSAAALLYEHHTRRSIESRISFLSIIKLAIPAAALAEAVACAVAVALHAWVAAGRVTGLFTIITCLN